MVADRPWTVDGPWTVDRPRTVEVPFTLLLESAVILQAVETEVRGLHAWQMLFLHGRLTKASSLQKSLCHGECRCKIPYWLVYQAITHSLVECKNCLVSKRPWNRLWCQLAYQAAPSALVMTYLLRSLRHKTPTVVCTPCPLFHSNSYSHKASNVRPNLAHLIGWRSCRTCNLSSKLVQ